MGKQKEFVVQDVAATLEKIKLKKSRWEGVWGTCSAHAVHSSETSESDTRSCQSCQLTVVCLLMLADTLQVTDMARRETWIVSCGRNLQQQGWWNLCCSSGGGGPLKPYLGEKWANMLSSFIRADWRACTCSEFGYCFSHKHLQVCQDGWWEVTCF